MRGLSLRPQVVASLTTSHRKPVPGNVKATGSEVEVLRQ